MKKDFQRITTGKRASSFQSIKQVLGRFDDRKDKYISREWQVFAVKIAEELNDKAHMSLYMKLARDLDRSILERARAFIKDAVADNKARLFMWKIGQLKSERAKEPFDFAQGKHQGK